MPPYTFTDPVNITAFNFLDNNELIIGTPAGLMHCKIKEPGNIEVVSPFAEVPETRITCIQKMRSGKGFYIPRRMTTFMLRAVQPVQVSPMKLDPGSQLTEFSTYEDVGQIYGWLLSSGLVGFRPIIGENPQVETLDKSMDSRLTMLRPSLKTTRNISAAALGKDVQITLKHSLF
jgi:hypothetical protein